MGYGHLRPAHALADQLDTVVFEADQPPLADRAERRTWQRVRGAYERLTRISQHRWVGAPFRALLSGITAIPELDGDLTRPTLGVRAQARLAGQGLGGGLIERLRQTGEPLLTTFYTSALIADRRVPGEVFCVVTDADVNRIWAPAAAAQTRIRYLAPSERVVARLQAYGVPATRIELTGFPLPPELLGGPDLDVSRTNLAARLARLGPSAAMRSDVEHELGPLPDPDRPPLLVFAVGGTGTQTSIVRRFLPSLRAPIIEGRLQLALVAGVRREVAGRFERWLRENQLADHGVEVLVESDFRAYYRAFNALLAGADVLWTKPSELTFYAGLGLPLVFAPPIGAHERYNRTWAIEQGAGIEQGAPEMAGQWLMRALEDGTLAHAAWAGFRRLPSRGLFNISAAVR